MCSNKHNVFYALAAYIRAIDDSHGASEASRGDGLPHLGSLGFACDLMGSSGLSLVFWALVGVAVLSWTPLAFLGFHGLFWARLGLHGGLLDYLLARLASPGRSCALLGLCGISWVLLGYPVVFWTRLGSSGFPCASLGYPRFVWAPRCCMYSSMVNVVIVRV